MVRQRERRLVQEFHRADLPDVRRARPLPFGGGEGRHAAISRGEEPLVHRRQQTHRRHAVHLVLHRNGILHAADGRKRIADNTLVALMLMIAESRPEEKDVMVKVVVNLINQNNG